jgi:protein tyrosine phosphatase (PTP) superfamily phosphohydrolase (DUF442 family)
MSKRLFGMLLAAMGCAVGGLGCHCCRPAPPVDTCASCPPRPLLGFLRPHPLTATAASPAPLIAAVPQPLPQAPPAPVPAPTPAAPDVRSYAPPPEPTWQPPTGGPIRSAVPGASSPEPPPANTRLYPPEPVSQSPEQPLKPAVAEERSRPPAAAEIPARPPALPVGIPQFAPVRDQVASGLKPLLDGLDWLQTNHYRAVLHLRAPGEDDAADRREIEKRGLKYLSLEVSPQTLTPEVVAQFNRIVTDPATYPLFVYDKDGMLAGGLWYLYYRMVERATDDEARTKANRLGLKENPEGDHRAMWLAIQKYLAR